MKVFISYRRNDTRDFAGRLSDRLRQELGISDVFLDIDEIQAGESFEQRIRSAVEKCAVALVLIGPEWRGASEAGAAARIFDERDFVRLEVREALSGKPKVIPVLVNGARMPSRDELPADLAPIVSLNAIPARHESFRRDADFIADAVLARKAPGPISRYWSRHPGQHAIFRSLCGLLIAVAALVGGAAIYNGVTGLSLDQALGGVGPVIMVAVGVLIAGLIFPLIFRKRRRAT